MKCKGLFRHTNMFGKGAVTSDEKQGIQGLLISADVGIQLHSVLPPVRIEGVTIGLPMKNVFLVVLQLIWSR